jgi:oxygen-dependent protoporphyrinogen oxidase
VRVAVVGGGITGLAAAWEARADCSVTVFEPGRLGGRILTEPFDGRRVELGPDAFLTRTPAAVDLCAELGMEDLVAPGAGRTLVWWRGQLRPLPEGLVLGVPRQLLPVARSGLLSPWGMVRALGDVVLPVGDLSEDVSVGDLVTRRFGRQVADRLVDPLVGSIHAGSIDELSAAATVPQLLESARRHRSLYLGLRRMPIQPASRSPFLTPRGGLTTMVSALVDGLTTAGVELRAEPVERIEADRSGWRLDPSAESFDAVVIATDASTAAGLLGAEAPAGLRQIGYTSVALTVMSCSSFDLPAGVNGFLVPRQSGWLTTACSFASSKWPQWAPPGRVLLRVSAGREGDRRHEDLGDEELVARHVEELQEALPGAPAPVASKVQRWPDSFPRYRVGHPRLVEGIEAELRSHFPGVAVGGSSYGGAGIPACIGSGRRAARSLLARAVLPQ